MGHLKDKAHYSSAVFQCDVPLFVTFEDLTIAAVFFILEWLCEQIDLLLHVILCPNPKVQQVEQFHLLRACN